MDVAHAILFAKTIDISRVTADYSSAKFEYHIEFYLLPFTHSIKGKEFSQKYLAIDNNK